MSHDKFFNIRKVKSTLINIIYLTIAMYVSWNFHNIHNPIVQLATLYSWLDPIASYTLYDQYNMLRKRNVGYKWVNTPAACTISGIKILAEEHPIHHKSHYILQSVYVSARISLLIYIRGVWVTTFFSKLTK